MDKVMVFAETYGWSIWITIKGIPARRGEFWLRRYASRRARYFARLYGIHTVTVVTSYNVPRHD